MGLQEQLDSFSMGLFEEERGDCTEALNVTIFSSFCDFHHAIATAQSYFFHRFRKCHHQKVLRLQRVEQRINGIQYNLR